LHRTINWAAGKETVLHGRADRIDKKGEASIVLDYKTQSTSTLKAKLEPHGEDVQLAVYALMSEAEQAGFVSMDSDKVRTMSPDLKDPPLSERALAESERIATTLYALAHGQALAAHGAEQTCLWCEMQGLCRRAHRETPTAI
jgi:RecB family exonuclease